MSRSLEEIRNNNKREDSLINTKVEDKEMNEELINQGKEEFENFVKPVRDRVYNRYLDKLYQMVDLNTPKNSDGIIIIPKDDEWRDEIYKLDEYATDGLYTDPEANTELNNIRIRDLIDWCERNNKDISKLSKEEIMKFTNNK